MRTVVGQDDHAYSFFSLLPSGIFIALLASLDLLQYKKPVIRMLEHSICLLNDESRSLDIINDSSAVPTKYAMIIQNNIYDRGLLCRV